MASQPDLLETFRRLDDAALIEKLESLIQHERQHLAPVLACIAETERRKVFADQGYPSMYVYMVRKLRYSEGGAVRRLRASRAASRYPEILSLISDSMISLCAVAFLAPFLTPENHDELLTRAQGLNRIGLERLVVSFAPGRDTKDYVRKLPAPEPSEGDAERSETTELPTGLGRTPDAAGATHPSIPTSPELVVTKLHPPEKTRYVAPIRVYFSFTASEEFHNGGQRAKELLRHKHPSGKLEEVFGEALECYLERHDPERRLRRKAEKEARGRESGAAAVASGGPAPAAAEASPETASTSPGASSSAATSSTAASSDERPSLRDYSPRRRIPHWVRDAVWARDAGRCTFIGPDGHRCPERGGLEFDHIIPWALGGTSNDPDNIRLLCRAHNQLSARRVFGEQLVKGRDADRGMERHRHSGGAVDNKDVW